MAKGSIPLSSANFPSRPHGTYSRTWFSPFHVWLFLLVLNVAEKPFSKMPIEAFMDDRLSKTELRVLGAIFSFNNSVTNESWPSRKQLAERCNLPLCKISTATTNLVELGWLNKTGNGGRSSYCTYKISVPEIEVKNVTDSVTIKTDKTVTEMVTVTNSVRVTDSVTETVTDSVTETVTDSVTETVTDSVRGNKQTINLPINRPFEEVKENSQFELFWKTYPNKTGKQDALRKWLKIKPPLQKILSALEWQRSSQQWQQGFIPNPATYLNQHRWEDEPKPDALTQMTAKQQQASIAARTFFGNETTNEKVINGEVIEHGATAKQLGR